MGKVDDGKVGYMRGSKESSILQPDTNSEMIHVTC